MIGALIGFVLGLLPSGEPLRTGMAEVHASSQRMTRTIQVFGIDTTLREVDQLFTTVSVQRYMTDNVTLGAGLIFFGSPNSLADSMGLVGRGRFYLLPLSRWTPWAELHVGGLFGLKAGNALRYGSSFGVRWVPMRHLALDVQLVGVERWKQSYLNDGIDSARIDWSLVRSPWVPAANRSDRQGFRPWLWPTLGIGILF